MGHGISDRRVGGAGDMWWGVLPLPPVAEPVEAPLTLRAELEGGLRAEARLATWRLVPGLDVQSLPLPATRAEATRPLVAVCMATFDPPLDLFSRQIESIRSQTHDNWVCVISDDNSTARATRRDPRDPGRRRALRARALRGSGVASTATSSGLSRWPRSRRITSPWPTRTTAGTPTSSRCSSASSRTGRCSRTAIRGSWTRAAACCRTPTGATGTTTTRTSPRW